MADQKLSTQAIIQALQSNVYDLQQRPTGDSITNVTNVSNNTSITSGNMAARSGYASLANALSAIGATPTTLLHDTDSTISSDTTIPGNVHLKFTNGAKITVAAGKTLTVDGSLEADGRQIFSLANSASKVDLYGANISTITPEMFGAKGDSVTDDYAAIQAAINSVQRLQNPFGSGGGGKLVELKFQPKTYYLSQQLTTKTPLRISGTLIDYRGYGSFLKFAPGVGGIYFQTNDPNGNLADDSIIENIALYGARTDATYRVARSGIRTNTRIIGKHVFVDCFEGNGWSIEGYGGSQNANLWTLTDCCGWDNNGSGLYVVGNDANAGISTGFNGTQNSRFAVED